MKNIECKNMVGLANAILLTEFETTKIVIFKTGRSSL